MIKSLLLSSALLFSPIQNLSPNYVNLKNVSFDDNINVDTPFDNSIQVYINGYNYTNLNGKYVKFNSNTQLYEFEIRVYSSMYQQSQGDMWTILYATEYNSNGSLDEYWNESSFSLKPNLNSQFLDYSVTIPVGNKEAITGNGVVSVVIDNIYLQSNIDLVPIHYEMEVIDVMPLLINILTLPFTFISQAFNFTFFPNSPYELNIGHIILFVVSILIFIFIIKTILSMKG